MAFAVDLGAGVFRPVLLTESSGKFLYVQTQAGLLIYSIDAVGGGLTPLSEPLTTLTFAKRTMVADPMEPDILWAGLEQAMLQVVDSAAGSPQGASIWLRSVRTAQCQRCRWSGRREWLPSRLRRALGRVTPQAIQLPLTIHQK